MATNTEIERRIQGAERALMRYRELLAEQPATLSPPVREALAWSRLEEEASPRAWEAARALATEPEPEPGSEPSEYRAEKDRFAVRMLRTGRASRALSVPMRWATDYPPEQGFVRERLKDGSIIFRPADLLPPGYNYTAAGDDDRRKRHMTPDQVREARRRATAGDSIAQISRDLNLTTKQVGAAVRGQSWKNV